MRATMLINGEPSEQTWPLERSCQYGDGVFETIAVFSGRPCLWNAHVERLLEGCDRLGLPAPDPLLLRGQAQQLAYGNECAVLKIAYSAAGGSRGYRRLRESAPTLIMSINPTSSRPIHEAWRVRLCDHRVGENPGLARIKHMNRLDQVLGRSEWDDPSIDEGIMCGLDGRIVAGTMTNIFMQRGNELLTPSIETAGIAGVVRNCMIESAITQDRPVRECRLEVADLRASDAVYLTNSIIGVVRVSACDDRDYRLSIPEHPVVPLVRERCHQPDIFG